MDPSLRPFDRRRGFVVCVALLILIQTALVSVSLPLSEVLTAKPILHIDYAYHAYQVHTAKILWGTHDVVGYDPYFAAGYLGGIPFNGSARIPAVISLLLADEAASFIAIKLFLLVGAILCVAAIPLACRSLDLDVRTTAVAGAFGCIVFWATAMRWYFVAGMSSYVVAAYLAVPFACWAASAVINEGWGRVLMLGFLGAFGTFCHPNFPVMAAPMILFLLAAHWRDLRIAPTAARMLALGALVVSLNSWWVLTTLAYADFFTSAKQPYQQAVDIAIPLLEPLGLARTADGGSRFYLVLIVGAGCGWLWFRRREVTTPLIATTIFFLVFAAIGSIVPAIAVLQPNRFSVFAWLVLVIPAAVGVMELCARFAKHRFRRLAIAAYLGFIALGSGFYLLETARELSPNSKGYYGTRPPEINGRGPITTELLKWVRESTNLDGRILFEQSRGRLHDGVHVAPYLAQMTGREFIGGPYPYQHFATFIDGVVFGKELKTLDPEDLRHRLRVYNVRWVICHSKAAKDFFSAVPWAKAEREAAWGGTLFRIDGQGGFFIRGEGVITERGFDSIKGKTESEGPVVLSYHWTPRLRVVPEAQLEKEWVLDDPVPFIRMPAPPKEFEIRFDARSEP